MAARSIAVSIVIPNLNSTVIGRVIEALHTQASHLEQVEVLVVGLDEPGQVHEDELVRRLPTGRPVPPATARNLGAAASRGGTLIFLDADCIPQPGWLQALLQAHESWPDAGAISGSMLPTGDTFWQRCGQISGFHEQLNLNPAGTRRTLASFSLLIPRRVWELVGGFDERFRAAAAEDLDFTIRIALRNYSLYFEPSAAVRHQPDRTSGGTLWHHAFVSGRESIRVRTHYVSYYRTPGWSLSPWPWLAFSPAIAVARATQIYATTPGLCRYWYCLPWVVLSKLAWCWGAASRLREAPNTMHKGTGLNH